MANRKTWRCVDCGEVHEKVLGGTFSTGYAEIGPRRRKVCYKCCGLRDRKYMRKNSRIILYLTSVPFVAGALHHNGATPPAVTWQVGNWPGTAVWPCSTPSKSRHNIARIRYDVWFRAEGFRWHGVQYGDNTQVVHCRRLRS